MTHCETPLVISQYGDVKLYQTNGPTTNWKTDNPISYDPVYTQIAPLDPNKHFVLFEHVPTNFDLLSSHYLNFQNIIITYTHDDIFSIAKNWFYKIIVPEFIYYKNRERWLRIAKTVFNDVTLDPTKLSKEQVTRSLEFIVNYDLGYPSAFFMNPKIPENYVDRVTLIGYRDILENSDKVLEILGNVINLPVTDIVTDNYSRYIRSQTLFEEKYFT
jgi:hypothetical protein